MMQDKASGNPQYEQQAKVALSFSLSLSLCVCLCGLSAHANCNSCFCHSFVLLAADNPFVSGLQDAFTDIKKGEVCHTFACSCHCVACRGKGHAHFQPKQRPNEYQQCAVRALAARANPIGTECICTSCRSHVHAMMGLS